MHEGKIGRGELRVDVALRVQPRHQGRIIERGSILMREPSRLRRTQIVGDRAFGDPERTGNLGVRETALLLESEHFANPSHGNP